DATRSEASGPSIATRAASAASLGDSGIASGGSARSKCGEPSRTRRHCRVGEVRSAIEAIVRCGSLPRRYRDERCHFACQQVGVRGTVRSVRRVTLLSITENTEMKQPRATEEYKKSSKSSSLWPSVPPLCSL